MAQIVVRQIEDRVKDRLKARARLHGWSMEEEVRQILRQAVEEPVDELPAGLGTRIAARFSSVGLSEPLPTWGGQAIEPMALPADPA